MTRDVGAEILGRARVDADREEDPVGIRGEGALYGLFVEAVPLDDRDPRAQLGGQLVGCAEECRYLVTRLETLGETFATEQTRGTEERDLHPSSEPRA